MKVYHHCVISSSSIVKPYRVRCPGLSAPKTKIVYRLLLDEHDSSSEFAHFEDMNDHFVALFVSICLWSSDHLHFYIQFISPRECQRDTKFGTGRSSPFCRNIHIHRHSKSHCIPSLSTCCLRLHTARLERRSVLLATLLVRAEVQHQAQGQV